MGKTGMLVFSFLMLVVKASKDWCEGSVYKEFQNTFGLMCDYNFDPKKSAKMCQFLLVGYLVLTIVLLGFLIAFYIL